MKTFLATAALGLLACVGVPAVAQEPKDERAAPIDPQRLSLAETTVDYVFPPGTYIRMMQSSLDAVMDTTVESLSALSLRDIARMGRIPEDRLAELGEGSLAEVMAILDPHYEERTRVGMRAMMDEMTVIMAQFEPDLRDGLAHAYARRFSEAQLAEMNAFFATPTGKVYAAESHLMFATPEMMERVQAFAPAILQQMPDMIATMEEASEQLPPVRRPEDLTEEERARLAELLGLEEEELFR